MKLIGSALARIFGGVETFEATVQVSYTAVVDVELASDAA